MICEQSDDFSQEYSRLYVKMVASATRLGLRCGEGTVRFPFLCKPKNTGKIIANRSFLQRRQAWGSFIGQLCITLKVRSFVRSLIRVNCNNGNILMALISLQDVVVAFGGPRVLDGVSLQLETRERVALLGRNGAGKTTMMRLLAGENRPDDGVVSFQKGIEVAYLPQDVPQDIEGTVFEVVLSGLGERATLLKDYHHVSHLLQTDHSKEVMDRLDRLQGELDRTNGWELDHQAEQVIARLKLNGEDLFSRLSGGQKRRVLLARALVRKPEVILLDEPTNHLDIDSIIWLEGFLREYQGLVFFITHDRRFMENLTTRILEIDRGRLLSWSCDYLAYLERRALNDTIEDARLTKFDKRLGEEEVWVRQGVKARRCRNEGRVKALEEMRAAKKRQRQRDGLVRMRAQEVDPSGHLVVKASRIGFNYGDKCLIRDFSVNIMRGDKIGVIGANGCGKSTLLRILLNKMPPTKGSIRFGTELQVAYFDQLRDGLDENKTVMENLCGEADSVMINGKPRHVIGYLQDFLFTPDRARTPVRVLSGGERNRLFLARLFTRPANVLVMDEPTNDLDVETLELLEELLVEYSGTLILVSHDRSFINNVVTSTLVFEGNGDINEYPGGYDDWLEQKANAAKAAAAENAAAARKPRVAAVSRPSTGSKLSFKEARELELLPGKIEAMEAEQGALCASLADPLLYKDHPAEAAALTARSQTLAYEIAEVYRRWEELETRRNSV
jgi:ATP-binding cassette subfamily F protein uup